MSAAVKPWQERMPAARAAFYCTMNCSGVGLHAIRDENCGDCSSTTVHGDPVAARDAEIADWRAAAIAKTESPALDDRKIADTVNELRDIAIQFHAAGQLRERIARVIVPMLKAVPAMVISDGFDEVLFDLCRKDDYNGLRQEFVKRGYLATPAMTVEPVETDDIRAALQECVWILERMDNIRHLSADFPALDNARRILATPAPAVQQGGEAVPGAWVWWAQPHEDDDPDDPDHGLAFGFYINAEREKSFANEPGFKNYTISKLVLQPAAAHPLMDDKASILSEPGRRWLPIDQIGEGDAH